MSDTKIERQLHLENRELNCRIALQEEKFRRRRRPGRRKVRTDLKVIFTSGYTTDAVHESFVLIPGIPFLSKPFGPGVLARKAREVLDNG